jgi:hypothetical protein
MAGGVTDAEKDRFIFVVRFVERLSAPGEPVHWILRVLEQVWRLFSRETISVRRWGDWVHRETIDQVSCKANWE